MSKKQSIKTGSETPTGGAKTYIVEGRIEPRTKTVRDTKAGKHPDHHVMKRNGKEFVRSNPDGKTSNNVDK